MTSSRELYEERLSAGTRAVKLARAKASEIGARLSDVAYGFMPIPPESIQDLLLNQARLLDEANQDLRKTEAIYRELLGDSPDDLATRDLAAARLERLLWHAREHIGEPYGPDMLRLYNLEEAPPAGARMLATYAHNTIALLRAHPQTLHNAFGGELDTERIAERLARPLTTLDDYVRRLDDMDRAVRDAQQARDAANEHWMRVWRGVCTTLEGVFMLAGRADLAADIRPFLPGLGLERERTPEELSNIQENELGEVI